MRKQCGTDQSAPSEQSDQSLNNLIVNMHSVDQVHVTALKTSFFRLVM